MNLSVIIPAYNESQNIAAVVRDVLRAADAVTDIKDLRIIVVDDHSSDGTYETVVGINDPRVSSIRLSRRSGSHAALRAGLRESKGDAALCISADGQDDPACLSEMMRKLASGAHIVWALRESRGGEPWFIRKPAEMFYKILFWVLAEKQSGIDLSSADFFLLDKTAIDAVNSCKERSTSLFGLIVWLGFDQKTVTYARPQRKSGISKWGFRSRFRLAKDWVIAFSGLPLKAASLVGISMSALGVIGIIYIIIVKLFLRNIITGWASLVVLVLTLGGIQLTIMGIMGEYIWRNLDESRSRPLYFIEKRSG